MVLYIKTKPGYINKKKIATTDEDANLIHIQ